MSTNNMTVNNMTLNKFKKIFGRQARRITHTNGVHAAVGDKLCMLRFKDHEHDIDTMKYIDSKSKDTLVEKHFGIEYQFPCCQTGITIKDIYGFDHEIFSYVKLDRKLAFFTVLKRYEDIYSGKQMVYCLSHKGYEQIMSLDSLNKFWISAKILDFDITTYAKSVFMGGVTMVINYNSLASEDTNLSE